MGWTILVFLAPVVAFAAAGAPGMQSRKTVLDGVYTEAQAGRGGAVFEERCASCHVGTCTDGPPLFGPQFLDRWREDTLEYLYTKIGKEMPQDAPGSLPEKTYLDILAYILHNNRFRAGTNELSSDAVKATQLVGPDGPRPLPSNALVQAVGCLEQGTNSTWNLTKVMDLSRAHQGNEINADEINAATRVALGTQSFRLPNAGSFRPGFKPETWTGHKVLAKGALARQTNGDRINLTALETVAASCAQ
jgi:mono/diheme cytochrome c family protein